MTRLGAAPQGAAKVAALARDFRAPAAPAAVRALVAGGPAGRAILAEIFASEAWKTNGLRDAWNWRKELVEAAQVLHMTEAIPFLLEEFRGGYSELAAKAMDDIRAYYERLATFQGYSAGSQTAIASVLEMLDVEDSDIRLAAVQSYAALAGKEGLPRLLQIAKSEKDPGVRKAALAAIERISLTAWPPNPPPRPPSPPHVPAPAGMSDDSPPK